MLIGQEAQAWISPWPVQGEPFCYRCQVIVIETERVVIPLAVYTTDTITDKSNLPYVTRTVVSIWFSPEFLYILFALCCHSRCG